MKKMLFVLYMLVCMSTMDAQVITRIKQVTGSETWVYLSDGSRVLYDTLPQGVFYSEGKTIADCIALAEAKKYIDEASCYQPPVGAGMGIYGGMYPMIGGNGTLFSIGNGHWEYTTSSSNYGGYQTRSTGIRIGALHIRTGSAGYSKSKNDTTTAKSSKKNSKKNSKTVLREVNLKDFTGGF